MPFYEVHCYPNQQLKDGKFVPIEPMRVASEDDLSAAYTNYGRLIQVNEDTLINPATQDILHRTKKDKEKGEFRHYFSSSTGILVNAITRVLIEGNKL